MSLRPLDLAALGISPSAQSAPPDISDPLLRSFTHDLRSPLFAILGYLQLLEHHVGKRTDPAKSIEYLRLAREAGLRLDHMVTEMLDLARFGHGSAAMDMGVISIADLFRRLWGTFQVIAQEKKISLCFSIKEDETLTVHADPRYLERALDNLIGNAIKFNHPEGRVAVSTWHDHGKTFFQVADTGVGIPPEAQDRIFEPFAQVRSSDRSMGYGLGLPIVQFIAKAHGGSVDVASTPGLASCFTLWIPDRQSASQ